MRTPRVSQDHSMRPSSGAGGFTVIELLIVIAIIAVLVSLLLPAISRVRNMAMGVQCASNMHDLMQGFLLFAADHDGHLPGCMYGSNDGTFAQSDWLYGQSGFNSAPQSGTVWPYVHSSKTYLCPSLELYSVGDFAQSNGRFDYGFFGNFAGARVAHVALRSNLTLLNGGVGSYPTPIVCQEDPYQFNGGNIEGDHCNVDQMSHIHSGGSYYGTIDGSTPFVIEPDMPNIWANGCWQWTCQGPTSHNMIPIASAGGWDWWDRQ